MDPFPDLATTDDDELERILRTAEDEADAISARRRALHAHIDALRAERVGRLTYGPAPVAMFKLVGMLLLAAAGAVAARLVLALDALD